MVRGRVAALEAVDRAVIMAGATALSSRMGYW